MIAIRWIVLAFAFALAADAVLLATRDLADPRRPFTVSELADLYADLARGAK